MTVLASFDIRGDTNSVTGFEPLNGAGAGQSVTQNGITLTVDVPFASFSGSSGLVTEEAHGIPAWVWRDFGFVTDASATALTVSGLAPGAQGFIRFGGANTGAGRHRLLTVDGNTYQNDNTGGTAPIVPDAPTDAPFTADVNGEVSFTLGYASVSAAFSVIQIIDVPSPTVALADNLQPGASFTLNYSNYDAIPVSPVTMTDSAGNSITVPVTISDSVNGTTGKHEGTATGTMPALPSSGSIAGLKFGTVNVSLSSA